MSRYYPAVRQPTIWEKDAKWPRDSADGRFVFLGNGVQIVGAALFPGEWTDNDPALAFSGRGEVVHAERRRTKEVIDFIGAAIARKEVGFALRPHGGGGFKLPREMEEWSRFGADDWNVDDFGPFFKFATLRGEAKTAYGSPDWIFVENATLAASISRRVGNFSSGMTGSILRVAAEIDADNQRRLSIFEATVMLARSMAKSSEPSTKGETDLFDIAANMLLRKLAEGEISATGLNFVTRLREQIPAEYWEEAKHTLIGFGTRTHHLLEFLDLEDDNAGPGGSLTLANSQSPAWVKIMISRDELSPKEPMANGALAATTEPPQALRRRKSSPSQAQIGQAVEQLWPDGKLPQRPGDRMKKIIAHIEARGETAPSPSSFERYFRENTPEAIK